MYPVRLEREWVTHPDADDEERELKLLVHPSPLAEAVAINYPGFDGSFDGYEDKYRELAEGLVRANVGVVRLENHPLLSVDYETKLLEDLRMAIRWVSKNGTYIGLASNPDIYLIGTSVGGAAAAAVASEFPAVKKVLLFAPAQRLEALVRAQLPEYAGELYVVVGDRDEIVGADVDAWYRGLARKARFRSCVLHDCDHNFRGALNRLHLLEIPVEVLVETPLMLAEAPEGSWAHARNETR
jgi:pimeloyl-ACP methyl ester carboxylesterase